MDNLTKAKRYAQEHLPELIDLIKQLCQIPAPSNQEQARAQFCSDWFKAAGFKNVYIDSALNAVASLGDLSGDVVIIMAHTDTVFPDTEPMPMKEEDGRLYCPGVCDDTANLAMLLMTARYLVQSGLEPDCGIVFAANAGEEGLGNLKGAKKLLADYGPRTREVISLDGSWQAICNEAVGSSRYRVEVKTEGGHSFSSFGNKNAIHQLAALINSIYSIKVPSDGQSRTTYNVGQIKGGTSVNTIAQQAEMLLEFRSDRAGFLAQLDAMLLSLLEAHRKMGLVINLELVGSRPCTGPVDPLRQKELTERYSRLMTEQTGQTPKVVSSSTDCNIPLSMGIPAVSFGALLGSGAHTREEWLDLASLARGWPLVMATALSYFS